jgi:hypothetical protein
MDTVVALTSTAEGGEEKKGVLHVTRSSVYMKVPRVL